RARSKTSVKPVEVEPKNKRNITLLFLLIVVLSTIVVYSSSIKNQWTNWDDEGYVLDNPLVRSIDLGSFFSTYVMGNYHPVTVLIQSIEYHFFKDNASGFHIISLFLHIINSLLIYWFIFRLTRKSVAAFLCALLFAVHPLHVESVSWVSAEKDLLYTL